MRWARLKPRLRNSWRPTFFRPFDAGRSAPQLRETHEFIEPAQTLDQRHPRIGTQALIRNHVVDVGGRSHRSRPRRWSDWREIMSARSSGRPAAFFMAMRSSMQATVTVTFATTLEIARRDNDSNGNGSVVSRSTTGPVPLRGRSPNCEHVLVTPPLLKWRGLCRVAQRQRRRGDKLQLLGNIKCGGEIGLVQRDRQVNVHCGPFNAVRLSARPPTSAYGTLCSANARKRST